MAPVLTRAELLARHCRPLGPESRLTGDLSAQLAVLSGWRVEGSELVKTFSFSNYYETMAFVNALAWVAHREDHHPDLSVHYNRCVVRFSTHSAGGLSENDLICAARCNELEPGGTGH